MLSLNTDLQTQVDKHFKFVPSITTRCDKGIYLELIIHMVFYRINVIICYCFYYIISI